MFFVASEIAIFEQKPNYWEFSVYVYLICSLLCFIAFLSMFFSNKEIPSKIVIPVLFAFILIFGLIVIINYLVPSGQEDIDVKKFNEIIEKRENIMIDEQSYILSQFNSFDDNTLDKENIVKKSEETNIKITNLLNLRKNQSVLLTTTNDPELTRLQANQITEKIVPTCLVLESNMQKLQEFLDNLNKRINATNVTTVISNYNSNLNQFRNSNGTNSLWGSNTHNELISWNSSINSFMDNNLRSITAAFNLNAFPESNGTYFNLSINEYFAFFRDILGQNYLYLRIDPLELTLPHVVFQGAVRAVEISSAYIPVLFSDSLVFADFLTMATDDNFINDTIKYRKNKSNLYIYTNNFSLCYNKDQNLLILQDQSRFIWCFYKNFTMRTQNVTSPIHTVFDYEQKIQKQYSFNGITESTLQTNQCFLVSATNPDFSKIIYFGFFSDLSNISFDLLVSGVSFTINSNIKTSEYNHVLVFFNTNVCTVIIINPNGSLAKNYTISGMQNTLVSDVEL